MTEFMGPESKRPWPAQVSGMPCTCAADGAQPGERCTRFWTRCNARLLSIRRWQWDEENRRGLAHPPGVDDPYEGGGMATEDVEILDLGDKEKTAKVLLALRSENIDLRVRLNGPIPMLLWCPMCQARHVDAGDFATKPHHTHACQGCGFTWRPAVVNTVGVRFLPGFKDEELPNGLVDVG